MTETTSSTTSGGFTDAVRAVLVEMDIDDLPTPTTISPGAHRHGGDVFVQVSPQHFDTWVQILGNRGPLRITAPAHDAGSLLGVVENVLVTGTINDIRVDLVTVRPAKLLGQQQHESHDLSAVEA